MTHKTKKVATEKNPHTLKINLPSHVGLHSLLAVAVLKMGAGDLHRAFVIWAVLRSDNRRYYTETELREIAKLTGKSDRSVSRWLKRGEGIFWNRGYSKKHKEHCYYWIGKDNVFAYFKLDNPGVVLTVNVDYLLNPKLKIVRATLKDCFINRETKFCSRRIIEDITGVKRRTQQLYDKESGLHRQYCCELKDWTDAKGKKHEVIQIPNIYHAPFERHHLNKSKRKKRYGLYVSDNNAIENLCPARSGETEANRFNNRFYFDDEQGANTKIDNMHDKGLTGSVIYKSYYTKRGCIVTKGIHTPY